MNTTDRTSSLQERGTTARQVERSAKQVAGAPTQSADDPSIPKSSSAPDAMSIEDSEDKLVTLDPTETTDDNITFAQWHCRGAAFAIDFLIPLTVMCSAMALWDVLERAGWVLFVAIVLCLGSFMFIVRNSVVVQGNTGSTVGKSLMGIRVVDGSGNPPGRARAFTRTCGYLANTIPLLLGWLCPLWTSRRQAFSDMLAGTIVVVDRNRGNSTRPRLLSLSMTVAAACSLIALATTSYVTGYAQDRDIEKTQREIAQIAGDKAVAVLSYKPETVEADMQTAKQNLTGAFLDYYSKYADDTVIPNSKRDQIGTSWELMGSAVTRATPDSAEVLVYLDGVVTKAGDVPNSLISSIRLQMTKDDGAWLISGLDPL
jgi:Mce-associated membrane protein